LISRLLIDEFMVKGLKSTSEQIVISGGFVETGVATFTEIEIDLTLNVLDREVFVVTAVDMNVFTPENIAALTTSVNGSLSTTTRATIGNISDSNVIAADQKVCRSSAVASVAFSEQSPDSPTGAGLEYMAIIATNNFFAQCIGVNNVAPRGLNFRVWGFRARADANIYSALVQSELLSA